MTIPIESIYAWTHTEPGGRETIIGVTLPTGPLWLLSFTHELAAQQRIVAESIAQREQAPVTLKRFDLAATVEVSHP